MQLNSRDLEATEIKHWEKIPDTETRLLQQVNNLEFGVEG